MSDYYIYGTGGHAKVVFSTLSKCNKKVIAFIDDSPIKSVFCSSPVITASDFKSDFSSKIHFAIGCNNTRRKLQTQWESLGAKAGIVIHTNSICYSKANIGDGSLIAAGSIVGPDSVLGAGCIVNHNAVVDHDCTIGDFCHIAPSATLGGSVSIGNLCLVGAGSIILPNLIIGNNVIIGAGSIVTHDIDDNVTVVGCPARPIY